VVVLSLTASIEGARVESPPEPFDPSGLLRPASGRRNDGKVLERELCEQLDRER
jgi:hypothetical protein